jgi:hypothetical protein
MAPKLGFEDPEEGEEDAEDEDGVLCGSLVTVAVTVSFAAELEDSVISRL